MKIALAQINTTVGDLSGNEGKILSAYRRGVAAGADIVVMPELTTTGYPPRDLLLKKEFIAQNLSVVERLAVATGKSRRGLDRALAATGLEQVFHATRCGDEGFTKPHPGMLLWLLDELDIARERALMIGDTSHDMQMAVAADVARVGVAYGAHPRENLLTHEPVACLDTFSELASWLTTLSAERTPAGYLSEFVPEVEDPTGFPPDVFRGVVDHIEQWCRRLAALL